MQPPVFMRGALQAEHVEAAGRSPMRRLIVRLALTLLLAYPPDKSFAQAGYWWYCFDRSHKTRLIYLSGTFGPAQTLMTSSGKPISQIWAEEFNDYIFHIFGEKGSAACNDYDTTGKLEWDKKKKFKQQFSEQFQGRLVETSWIPTHMW
jgi:hypothetical protein